MRFSVTKDFAPAELGSQHGSSWFKSMPSHCDGNHADRARIQP